MSDLDAARDAPEDLLWQNLDAVHAGMLGIEGSGQHMQPMAHHTDRANRRLWFLTRRDTDLYRAIHAGSAAHFCVISKRQDFHACLDGVLTEHLDPEKLDEMWTPINAAWFSGKEDPDLKMLALDLRSAAIWASTDSALAFAWETAKANLSNSTPDVGVHNEVVFA